MQSELSVPPTGWFSTFSEGKGGQGFTLSLRNHASVLFNFFHNSRLIRRIQQNKIE